jgi:outer membrane lipoprotein SlyB
MTISSPTPDRSKLHPLLILAAIAVLLFSLVGTAAIMGWLPSSRGDARNNLRDAERATAAANGPGYAAGAPVAGTIGPGAPVAGTIGPDAAQPRQPVQSAPYNAQSLAGYRGMDGATGTGTQAPVYLPEERAARVTEPYRPQRNARVADTDTGSHWCSTCGNVESVRAIATRARGTGVGAAGGAVLGGLLGNQVGGGHGRQLATVAGAVGGAVFGNQVEGNMRATTSYEIRVRLDDGTLRTFHQHSAPQWRSGDRVRIVKGSLHSA